MGISYIYFYQRTVPVSDVLGDKVWAKTVEYLPPVDGVGLPRAENCGKCHTEIYKEWKLSTHAHALSDIQFQAELTKETSPKWLCLNCHIPIQNQREKIVTGLKAGNLYKPIEILNPHFDPVMKQEAITCATCHVRVDSQTQKSYVIGANGKTNPPHPIRIQKEFLQNRCLDCHNETYTLNNSLVCSFQTGSEMQKNNPESSCSNCHLPEVKRSFVKQEMGKPVRISHKHGFVGGGVPKEFPLYKHQVELGYKPGIVLESIEEKQGMLILKIRNTFANHKVTSGDPERFYELSLQGFSRENMVVVKETKKLGQIWEWSPSPKKISDNRLHPNESLEWNLKMNPLVTKYIFQAKHIRLKNMTSYYMENIAKETPSEFQNQIQKIKNLYPHSSIVLETKWEVQGKNRKDTSLHDLMKKNELRRGE